jgi:hypothetical protein
VPWEELKLEERPSTTCTWVTTGWVGLLLAAVGKMAASVGMFAISTMACRDPEGWEGWMEPREYEDGAVLEFDCGEGARVGFGVGARAFRTVRFCPRAACSSSDLTLVEEGEVEVGGSKVGLEDDADWCS